MRKKVKRRIDFAILITYLFFSFFTSMLSAEEVDKVQFVNKQNSEFKALLTPDPSFGQIPTNRSDTVKVSVNNKPIPFNLSKAADGNAKVSGTLPVLAEGRHKTNITTLLPDKSVKDSQEILFFLDSIPPTIEMVEPSTISDLTALPSTLLFKLIDHGSGIDYDINNANPQIIVSGYEVIHKDLLLINSIQHLRVELNRSPNINNLGISVPIEVSIQDRAGNVGKKNWNIQVRDIIFEYGRLECPDYSLKLVSLDSIVTHTNPKELDLQYGNDTEITLSLFQAIPLDEKIFWATSPQNGLNYNYAKHKPANDPNQPEIIEKSDFLKVQLISKAENRFHYKVSQTKPAPPNLQLDFVTFKVPTSYNNDISQWSCEEILKHGYHYKESGSGYTFSEISIPVLLQTDLNTFENRVFTKDGLVISEVYQSITPVDIEKSWFELEGSTNWFSPKEQNYISAIASNEGYKSFTSTIYTHGSNEENTFQGKILVQLAPPEIKEFAYDPVKKQATALIADVGTPLSELEIELLLNNVETLAQFDTSTGKLKADISLKIDSSNSLELKVTDKAKYTKTQTLTITSESYSKSEYRYSTTSSAKAGKGISASNMAEQLALWEAAIKTAKRTEKNGYDLNIKWWLSLKQKYDEALDKRSAENQNDFEIGTHYKLPSAPFFGTISGSGDQSLLPKIYLPHADNENSATPLPSLTILSEANEGLSLVRKCIWWSERYGSTDFRLWWESGADFKGDYTDIIVKLGSEYNNYATQYCRTGIKDVLPPAIEELRYNPGTKSLNAIIHDHGQPVKNLSVSVSLQDETQRLRKLVLKRDVTLNAINEKKGLLSETIKIPPSSEHVTFEVSATDKDKNQGQAWLHVSRSVAPPEVELELIDKATTEHNLLYDGAEISAQLAAKATDQSIIVKTNLWIDGYVTPPFSEKTTFDYIAYLESFTGYYASKLSEGKHEARFQAIDEFGLAAEKSLTFDITYAPVINDFKIENIVDFESTYGPIFTAYIFDKGEDLQSSGINVKLDDKQLSTSDYFYDPLTKYFAVYGPLNISSGSHSIILTAVDQNNNKAEKSLSFYIGSDTVLTGNNNGSIKIQSPFIWELENQNNDGQVNPGEYVRLFLPLLNDSNKVFSSCSAKLITKDSSITVEKDFDTYGDITPFILNQTTHGYDLRIGQEILSTTLSDPYEAHFNLELNCDNGNLTIPFSLPIYRPSISTGVNTSIKVEFDRLPRTTAKSEIAITGKVSAVYSEIDRLVLYVNGEEKDIKRFDRSSGEFEATIQLNAISNLIEAHAYDKNGAMGIDTIVITCTGGVTVDIDSTPRTTSQSEIQITGTAKSTIGTIQNIELRVNGQPFDIRLDENSNIFTSNITLSAGSNLIAVTATDSNSLTGRDSSRINSTGGSSGYASYTAPSIQITAPSNGDTIRAGSTWVSGTFDTGSGTLRAITPSAGWVCNPGARSLRTAPTNSGAGVSLIPATPNYKGRGTFEGTCTNSALLWQSTNTIIRFTISTQEGSSASDSSSITTEPIYY